MKSQKLKVELMATDALVPYANNPKEHPPEQVDQICASIKAFGFNDPIAIDEDNVIIEGHGRLLAAQKLGISKVPVIQLKHLTEAEKRAYMLAHNKLTLNSEWDLEMLQVELESLKGLEFDDLTLTGFTADELENFSLEQSDTTTSSTDEDSEKPEVSINYQNQYGVIVQCDSEEQQQRVYNELTEAGYTCKVVVV